MFIAAAGVKAQDCDAIMLPYFGNDKAKMDVYKTEAAYKFEWRCAFARAAFYESDTVPAGVEVFRISEVKNLSTGRFLKQNFDVNLATLSYYAYNFSEFQHRYPHVDKAVCFSTPGSRHPYLVLRSIVEMHNIVNQSTIINTSN